MYQVLCSGWYIGMFGLELSRNGRAISWRKRAANLMMEQLSLSSFMYRYKGYAVNQSVFTSLRPLNMLVLSHRTPYYHVPQHKSLRRKSEHSPNAYQTTSSVSMTRNETSYIHSGTEHRLEILLIQTSEIDTLVGSASAVFIITRAHVRMVSDK
jgi:hypothetical protein